MRIIFLSLILLFITLSGGCATLLRGSHQTMKFETKPSGAQVIVDGKWYTSPVSLSLQRKVSHDVRIVMGGYRTVEFVIDPQWDGISLVGNIIMPGGSVGLVADRVSGADLSFYKLAEIRLLPAPQPPRPQPPPLVLNDFKGHLLTDAQVQEAIAADRQDRSQFFRGEP
jgi:hypothetical protein